MVVDKKDDDDESHLDCCNGEVSRWVGSDRLEASVRLGLETVAHRKHLNIVMRVVMVMI